MRSHLSDYLALLDQWHSQTAVVERDHARTVRTSYAQLAAAARAVAAHLDTLAITKGDRVLLCAPNGWRWLAVWFGCLLRGAVVVPLDLQSAPGFVDRVLADTQPRWILVPPEVAPTLQSRGLPADPIHIVDHLPASNTGPSPGLGPQDYLQIVFTSGTTAEPKGVVHTHHNLLVSIAPIENEIEKYRRYERFFHPLRFLHTLPFSHVFGQFMGIWMPAILGAELHLAPALSPARLAATIRSERIHVLVTVPRVLEGFHGYLQDRFPFIQEKIDHSRGHFLKSWWTFRDIHRHLGWQFWAAILGGATLPPQLEQFYRALGYAIIQGYGLTETAALVSINHPFKISRGSIGQVLPGREIQLAPDGEILVRGHNLAPATWIAGRAQHREGEWLATGDLGALDPQGNLFFRGRKKDVIVTAAGLNIYPADLEAAFQPDPRVRDCAIVGLDSPLGPEPLVALILDPGVEPAAVIQAANDRLAEYQRIRRWLVWPDAELPRTTTGKILRRVILDAALTESPVGAPSSTSRDQWLLRTIERITRRPLLNPAPNEDLVTGLKLDSLARVQLMAALEDEYGLVLSDDAFSQLKTLADLTALLTTPHSPRVVVHSAEPALAYPYPRWPWLWPWRMLRLCVLEAVVIPLTRRLGQPVVQGQLEPIGQPTLIIANHVTSYDVPLILYALPPSIRRRTAVAMSGEMLRNWRHPHGTAIQRVVGWSQYVLTAALFNVFSLPRESAFRESLQHAGEAMDRGFHVIVFPEGTRSYSEQMAPFQPGIGVLIQSLHCRVITVHLRGLGTLAEAGRRPHQRGEIAIEVQGPFDVDARQDPAAIARELEARFTR